MNNERQHTLVQAQAHAEEVNRIFMWLWPNNTAIERYHLAAWVTGQSWSAIKGNMQRPFMSNSSYVNKNGFSKPLLLAMRSYATLVKLKALEPATLESIKTEQV